MAGTLRETKVERGTLCFELLVLKSWYTDSAYSEKSDVALLIVPHSFPVRRIRRKYESHVLHTHAADRYSVASDAIK
jgi:hypothetical protein